MDQPTDLDQRVGQLEESVELLTSEVTLLRLELTTMLKTARDSELPQLRSSLPARRVVIAPPVRPSMTPAAIVVMLAVALLSWQLIVTPYSDPSLALANAKTGAIPPPFVPQVAAATVSTEPSIAQVHPRIYKGTLSVNADHPGAKVFVNRQIVGTAPVRVRNLRAGAHLVWVEREGYRRWTRVITVPAERVTRVSADLEPVVEHED